MIYTLIYRCFQICCNWSMFRQQLILLREIFQKNGYPENFIDRCFKLCLNRIHILNKKLPTVEEKSLRLVLPYLAAISLRSRTKLQSPTKGYLNAVNYKLFLKFKVNSVIILALNTLFLKFLH